MGVVKMASAAEITGVENVSADKSPDATRNRGF